MHDDEIIRLVSAVERIANALELLVARQVFPAIFKTDVPEQEETSD